MVQGFIPPPKFYFEKLVEKATPEQVFGAVKAWIAAQRGRVVHERAPQALVAHHGDRKFTWGDRTGRAQGA